MKSTLLIMSMIMLSVIVDHQHRQPRIIEPPPAQPSEWDIFIEALIWVESRGNETIEGTKGDRGVLQITPTYINECNRLIGKNRYTHNDAYDRQKSLEMFEVIQSYHNPTKDIKRAIKLHNPRAGEKYQQAILRRMDSIKTKQL